MVDPIIETFSNRLFVLVDETHKTKGQIARELGIVFCDFSKYYNYRVLPSTRTMIKLAQYFDVSIDYLLGLKDERN